jgi:hypothetical protein
VSDPKGFVGSVLGHYRLIEQIGAGGMGVVYRARDASLDRDVAIKLLPDSGFDDRAARARLLREARTASRLNHPRICTIYQVGEAVPLAEGLTTPDTPALFIAMELVGVPRSPRTLPWAPWHLARLPGSVFSSLMASDMPTRGASFIAISGAPASCSRRKAGPRSSTSAWPRRSTALGRAMLPQARRPPR